MVAKDQIPAVTAFSGAFAAALTALVDDLTVSPSRQAIADQAGRSRAFISDQLRGVRPVDTDTIAAISDLIGTPPRTLVRQVLTRMPPDVLGIPGVPRPAPDPNNVEEVEAFLADETPPVELAERRRGRVGRPVKKAARKDPE